MSEGITIDRALVQRVAAAWPKRATIRSDMVTIESGREYEEGRPDYPMEMVPFHDHPDFLALPAAQRDEVLTWAWIVYNQRVISAEEHIANPAFALVMQGVFPGSDDFAFRRAVQQALVDEHWHTYMHMMAIERAKELRGLVSVPRFPHGVTYQRFLHAAAELPEQWERDLLNLVWATVAEVSINAYLTLLSRNKEIQPMHSLVTALHARDESAHGSLMVEVAKSLYVHMNRRQRRAFVDAMPKALEAFVAQDYSAWRAILGHLGVANGEAIVAECENGGGTSKVVRNFNGIRKLARELDIYDEIADALPDFEGQRDEPAAAADDGDAGLLTQLRVP
jgi:4-aminobenzoate N-oxygenase